MLRKRWQFIVFVVTCVLQAHGADKYTDENRPYEFGFKIEGEQHRHEKKDENGLIMGEFGFITADGVYHVTVYATDENGNFKILSMKNIRVKPYPSGPERTGHSLPFPPSQNASPTSSLTEKNPLPDAAKPAPPAPVKSCSSCSLPTTTTTTQKPKLTDFAFESNNLPPNEFGGSRAVVPQDPQNTQQNNLVQNSNVGGGQSYPSVGLERKLPEVDLRFNIPESDTYPQPGEELKKNDQQDNVYNQIPQQNSIPSPEKTLQAPFENSPGERNPKQFTDYTQQPGVGERSQLSGNDQYNPTTYESQDPQSPQGPQGFQGPQGSIQSQGSLRPQGAEVLLGPNERQGSYGPRGSFGLPNSNERGGPSKAHVSNGPQGPQGTQSSLSNKPTLISAQMQIVDRNTDIRNNRPGEVDGLPNGLTKDNMLQLLYTFNYTVGFHGHFEEGYTNGAKQGYYYVTGRNGVRTRVDYVADENGFRPKITQEVLDLLSDDVPKPETEKDEKYGLKGYEFKWLYYPVESKSS